MKPFPQKLSLSQNTSFAVQTISTPAFRTGWHQHIEFELTLFTEGSGVAYIGEYEGKFEAGDIYFLGSNLPHAYKSHHNHLVSAVVIQFRESCLGNHFMNLPECKTIKELLETAGHGLQVYGNSKLRLEVLIKALEKAAGINRIIMLLQCMQIMSTEKEYIVLTKKKARGVIDKTSEAIDKVLEFTQSSFHDRITLSKVAAVACMSIPSFCHQFKQHTGKTYIDYLNEVRIHYACRQLRKTNKPVTEICYESGYKTIGHFHRQFLRLKRTTPLQYRKKHLIEISAEYKTYNIAY